MENAVPGVALSTIVGRLLESIAGARKTAKKFKPLLSHLKETVKWITPRVEKISRSTNSHEIDRLLTDLIQAKELVDKCSRVSSWRIYKKYNFAKELIKVDNSIRTKLDVFFPVMIYEDTRKIMDSVDELKMLFSIFFYIMLEDFHSGAKNTGGAIFDLIRSKGSFQSLGFDKIVHSQPAEIVNDIALWKRKKISGSLLASSTATWLLQQVYEYNFLTIVSWIAIFLITSLFIWRYWNRFLDQEEEAKSRLERIREQVAMETANACYEVTDKVIKWILHVTDVEGNWPVFPQTVVFLLLFSYMGSFFDLSTLRNGVMMGTTVPVMVAKHGDRIKPLGSMVGKVFEMLTNTIKNNVAEEMMKKKKLKKQY